MLKRYLKTCVRCMENEVDIDICLTPAEYRNSRLFPKIPRVSRWIAHWHKMKVVFFIAYWILMILWIFGGGILYLLAKHVGYLYEMLKANLVEIDKDASVDVVLFLENNTADFVSDFTQRKPSQIWIVPPKYRAECERTYAARENYLDVESIVSLMDIYKCFIISLFALYLCPFRSKLQMYAIPDCLLTNIALNKINIATLTCTAHFDRWAVMVNDFCEEKNIEYRLIQHGSIKGIVLKSNQHYYVTNKLTSVSELVVYDKIEEELMLKHIIDPQNIPLRTRYAKPGFKVDKSVKGDVLFIGHPLYESLHVAIYHALELSDYQVYYKAHPRAQATQSINHVGWRLIDSETTFPHVDLVISYHSTLALMYEDVGAKVFIHENEEVNSSDYVSFICKIRESLRRHDYH